MTEENPHFQTDLSVGEILRRTRSHYNQTLPDIERALRIRASQLQALEDGNYDQLPGRVYVIGFIRSYSEYLGLDGDKMVHLFKTQSGGKVAQPASLGFQVPASDTKMPQSWHIILSVLAVLAVLGIWMSMQKQDRAIVTDIPSVAEVAENAPAAQTTQAQSAVAATATPPVETAAAPLNTNAAPVEGEPPQPAPVTNTPDAVGAEIEAAIADAPATETAAGAETVPAIDPNEKAAAEAAAKAAIEADAAQSAEKQAEKENGVILNIKKNSWVEIRGKDGKAIVSRVLKAGDRYFVPARADLTISLGNSGGVELEVEGKKLKPLGADGEVKRNIPLNAAALKKNYGQ